MAVPTSGSTSRVVIEELGFLFSQFGLPECLVSDNGTCFTIAAPYHSSTNGLAERTVQLVKRGLRKETHGSKRSRRLLCYLLIG